VSAEAVSLYGIKACDTMRKARVWLDSAGVAYEFHDYKRAGIEAEVLRGWAERVGWERLLNRSGTTFRKLPDERKVGLDEVRALELMVEAPSMIRRPVLVAGEDVLVGFDPAVYAARFGGEGKVKGDVTKLLLAGQRSPR